MDDTRSLTSLRIKSASSAASHVTTRSEPLPKRIKSAPPRLHGDHVPKLKFHPLPIGDHQIETFERTSGFHIPMLADKDPRELEKEKKRNNLKAFEAWLQVKHQAAAMKHSKPLRPQGDLAPSSTSSSFAPPQKTVQMRQEGVDAIRKQKAEEAYQQWLRKKFPPKQRVKKPSEPHEVFVYVPQKTEAEKQAEEHKLYHGLYESMKPPKTASNPNGLRVVRHTPAGYSTRNHPGGGDKPSSSSERSPSTTLQTSPSQGGKFDVLMQSLHSIVLGDRFSAMQQPLASKIVH